MEYHLSLNADRSSIVIMRVENGWVVRTHQGMQSSQETPLRVAETPEALLEIIGEWARSQVAATGVPTTYTQSGGRNYL